MSANAKPPTSRRASDKAQPCVLTFPTQPLMEVLPDPDPDTVAAAERLLIEAREGKIRGLAFVALMTQRRYVVYACGDVRRERVYARGMLRELDDELSKRGRDDE